MDEILIGEKKYVSSKQAAKATGYAKDYIGQLCREGRVPARLVGRSWYVLESAIHDHRFGDPKHEPAKAAEVDSSASFLHPTWESPRYEASETEVLPSINLLRESHSFELSEDKNKDVEVTTQHLQDMWQAWFDRFDYTATQNSTAAGESEKKQEKIEIEQNHEVKIPIHAIHHPPYQSPPEELLPSRLETKIQHEQKEPTMVVQEGRKRGRGGLVRTIQTIGVLFAVFIAGAAVLGSGYLDEYILSNSQVGIISGVTIYNK